MRKRNIIALCSIIYASVFFGAMPVHAATIGYEGGYGGVSVTGGFQCWTPGQGQFTMGGNSNNRSVSDASSCGGIGSGSRNNSSWYPYGTIYIYPYGTTYPYGYQYPYGNSYGNSYDGYSYSPYNSSGGGYYINIFQPDNTSNTPSGYSGYGNYNPYMQNYYPTSYPTMQNYYPMYSSYSSSPQQNYPSYYNY